MNKLISGKQFDLRQLPNGTYEYEMEKKTPLYAGTITSGVSTQFVQFTKVFKELPTISQILADPENCQVPMENGTKYAAVMHVLEYVTAENFALCINYISRFSATLQVVFFRGIKIRKPELRPHPEFAKALVRLSNYLNDW
jgi:hypothetical protein